MMMMVTAMVVVTKARHVGDQSNLVPSYVSGNYYGYYIQLGVRGYLGLKVLRLGWERFKKCIVYMAQDLCGYYTRII